MIDFQDRIKDHRYVGTGEGTVSRERAVSSIFKMVYGLMFLGLALSGGVAWMFFRTEAYKSVNFTLLIVLELALVIILSFCFQKLSYWVALGMFLLYSALNGATLSVIFLAY
ncbi:Bax inhibitor-1 family protein, partial [bacterium]|nr:Bax inhibitor-1 family protein [bacterium]